MNTSTNIPPAGRGRMTIGLCFLVALLEGLDLQSTGAAAPRMAHEFHLAAAQLGWVFGIGALGLLPGSAIGGWLADRVGRKRILMLSVALFGIFSIATTQVWDLHSLLAARFLTGLGLGAAMPNLIALCSEATSVERRGSVVGAMYCGLPFGATFASLVAIVSPGDDAWRHIFYLGGIGPLLTLPLLALFLQESSQYLIAAQYGRRKDFGDVNTALWKEGRAGTTVALWTSYLCTLIVLYFLINWLPSLVLSRGLTRVQASVVQIMFNVGAGIGAISIAALFDRFGKRQVVTATYIGVAGALLALASAAGGVSMAGGGFLVGLFLTGAQSVLYALAGTAYPVAVRGTGVGAAGAVGRLGSMVGPLFAGMLLAMGQSATMLVMSSIPLIVIAAVALLKLVAILARETRTSSHGLEAGSPGN